MSMPRGAFPPGRNDVGQTVASFPSYEAAQRAVSTLIAGDIPAREIVIVGIGIRSVERVTGRLGYASAARSGAVNGVLLGLVLSAFFVLGSPSVQIPVFLGVMFIGIAIGMLFSLLLYVLLRRRRDYASVMQFVADSYEVNVSAGDVPRARVLLGAVSPVPLRTSTPETPPAPSAADREPPRYGQRIDEPPVVDPEPGSRADDPEDRVDAPEPEPRDSGASAPSDDAR